MTGDVAAIERLVATGANPNAKKDGSPAVWWAAYLGHVEAVSELVRLGADPNARQGNGETTLMWAASHGRVEIARALLVGRADRTLRATRAQDEGKTALEIAERVEGWESDETKRGKVDVAALLRA